MKASEAAIRAPESSDAHGSEPLPLPTEIGEAPVFAEPWQAQAFAITLLLHERGLFDWNEWAELLASEIRAARPNGDADDGATYYRQWLNALEKLVVGKQLGSQDQIHRLEHAWQAAAERTPHGQPITLESMDLLCKM